MGRLTTDVLTLPYYRFYRQNTLLPILSIAQSVDELHAANPYHFTSSPPEPTTQPDTQRPPSTPAHACTEDLIFGELKRWRQRKLDELRLVMVASTLLSAAVIGCFSWNLNAENQHWIGPASWHASLVLSTFAILLASSEQFIFNTIQNSKKDRKLETELAMILSINHDVRHEPKTEDEGDVWGRRTSGDMRDLEAEAGLSVIAGLNSRVAVGENITTEKVQKSWWPTKLPPVGIRWHMVFTWQAPMMLMAYSVVAFLVGLTVFVCTPLYDEEGKPSVGEKSVSRPILGCFGWLLM